jgi:hypothetical protein
MKESDPIRRMRELGPNERLLPQKYNEVAKAINRGMNGVAAPKQKRREFPSVGTSALPTNVRFLTEDTSQSLTGIPINH